MKKQIFPLISFLLLTLLPAVAQEKTEIPADSVTAAAVTLPPEVSELIENCEAYCAQSFWDMEQNELEKFRALLSDKNYPQALAMRDKISATLSLWHEIDGYKRLLYEPFQYDKIKRVRERIYEMQDEMSPAQYEVIYEQIDSPLSRYYHGVKFFQEVLITKFNEKVDKARKERNISEVRREFTEMLKDPEVKKNIQERIGAVPWLQKKFTDYQQYIMNRNSSPRGPQAQDIMKISLSPAQ